MKMTEHPSAARVFRVEKRSLRLKGGKDCSGFVEDEDPGVPVEGLEDLHLLLASYGERPDGASGSTESPNRSWRARSSSARR